VKPEHERMRRGLLRILGRGGFRRQVLTLLSGSGIALTVAYFTQPVLTRLYAPDAFGTSDYFGMLLAVFLTIGSLRYEDAVMTPRDDQEASAVLRLALLLTLGWALLLSVTVLWREPLCAALGVPGLAPWLWLLPLTLVLSKASRLMEAWLSRLKRFRPISVGQVAATSAVAGTRITAGVLASVPGPGGLIGGTAVGHMVTTLLYAPLVARLRPVLRSPEETRRPSPAWIARRYRRFAIYSMPAAFLNSIVTRLPVVLLPIYFSVTAVGLYGRAFLTLAVPLGLVGSAVAQVFFVHAGEAHRAGALGPLAGAVHRRLVLVGLFPTLAVMAAGPDLFEIVFGADWRPAGGYLQVLAPWLFTSAIASPLTRIFDVLERQRADLLTSIFMFLLLGTALAAGGRTGEIGLTLVLLGVTGTFVRLVHLGTMLRLAGVRLRVTLVPYLEFGVIALPLAVLLWLVATRVAPLATLATAIVTGAVYYGIAAWREGIFSPDETQADDHLKNRPE